MLAFFGYLKMAQSSSPTDRKYGTDSDFHFHSSKFNQQSVLSIKNLILGTYHSKQAALCPAFQCARWHSFPQ